MPDDDVKPISGEKPPVLVPLIPDPPQQQPPQTPPVPPGMRAWVLLRGTTILGLVFLLLGIAGFVVYMTTDKDHLHETVFLFVCIGMIAFGAHLISRQSVKSFLADFGRFIPWGKKDGEPPVEGG
jgi:hypothetical protein